MILSYIFIAMIPYIRYAVVAQHSFTHSFMTYRAQVASVIALCLITYEIYLKIKYLARL